MTTTTAPEPAAAKSSPFRRLAEALRAAGVARSVGSTLSWDQEVMMPPAGAAFRAEQLEMISTIAHERATSPEIGALIAECEADSALAGDPVASADLREIRRDYDKATKLPTSLVAEIARCRSLGMEAWKKARAESDFNAFLPWLEKTVDLNKQKAECYGIPEWGAELYDALLDEYEPRTSAAQVAELFAPLRAFTVPLLEKVRAAKTPEEARLETVEFPIEKQKAFTTRVLTRMGFDFEAGRLDEAVHPFCESPGVGDTRLTNRYRPDGWLDQLSSGAHEAGHGMYEQGLPKAQRFGLPSAEAISLGIHESQSRMWENQVGRSLAFWEWALPVAREELGPGLEGATPEQLFRASNIVRPSFIRVEADELTYNLHIMLRFDLERALISGDLAPADVPGVWNERMKSDLGVDVPDDRRGCLQDIHWSMSAIGYFSTYTLGNLYAAQFWEAMARDLPERGALVAHGEFAPILAWLRDNIHAHGRVHTAADLCEKVTGKPLSADALTEYLGAKVEAVYGVTA